MLQHVDDIAVINTLSTWGDDRDPDTWPPNTWAMCTPRYTVNTLRPRQDGCHFPDDIFRCIFLNENVWISLKISLKFIPQVSMNNIPALFQIMDGRRSSDKPLSEMMMVILLTHICVTRPQWVNMVRALLCFVVVWYLWILPIPLRVIHWWPI